MMLNLETWCRRQAFWLGDALRGGPLRRSRDEALRIFADPDGTAAIRREKLRSILDYARRNVPYYADIKGNRLEDFPVMDKQTLLAHQDEFQVADAKIPGQRGPVHVQRTSGSTGVPMAIRQDTRCRLHRVALIKAANETLGFHDFMPLLHLRPMRICYDVEETLLWRRDLGILYADNSNLTDEGIRVILEEMSARRIRFVRGYAGSIDQLTRYVLEHGVRLNPRPTFIAGGEMLTDGLRRRIVEELGCPVVSQYATEEFGVIGQSALDGPGSDMRLYLANCRVEILRLDEDVPVADGEIGRIVITDYTNRAMPLIRYDTGDLARVGARTAEGEVSRLADLAGCRLDVVYRTDGSPVNFYFAIPRELDQESRIWQFQLVQRGAREYALRLSVREDSVRAEGDRFARLVRDILGADAEVDVEFVDALPVLSSGKRKCVVQEWRGHHEN